MLVHALHAALEDRVVTLDRIGVNGVDDELIALDCKLMPHIFVGAMLDGLVAGKLTAQCRIPSRLVRHQCAFLGDVVAHDGRNVPEGYAVNMEAAGRSAPLYERQDDIAELRAAL